MVRILIYIAIVFVLAFGFAWLADRPGALQVTWQGYDYEISLVIALAAILALFAVLLLLLWLFRAVVSAPRAVGGYFTARRRDRGYRALSRGMIAVGAGDRRVATRAADEAVGLLGEEPMTLLLSAQAAQLSGNGDAARTAFEKLADQRETRVLGLHGLFVEARRQGEQEAARHFAEEAVRTAPKIGWAGEALFEYQARGGDWLGALRTLGANADAKLVDKEAARRLRAVLLTAWALETEASEPDEARARAQEAHRLAPAFSEAAVVAGRLLSRSGDFRRAARVLETAWKDAPHPDIADTYLAVRPGDSVRDRLKRMRRLAELRPNHPEGAMALARAAIDAHDWKTAQTALDGLARSNPTERVCVLMAEIEGGEHGDEGRVRSWLARAINAPRDPTWVADGRTYQHWAPLSPVSGQLDAFEWKVVEDRSAEPRISEIDVALEQLTLPATMVMSETVAASEIEPEEVTPSQPPADVVEVEAAALAENAEAESESREPDDEKFEATAARPAEVPKDLTPSRASPVAPQVTTGEAETAAEKAEVPEEEVPMPRPPDDPGPEPSDEGQKPRRNLFGYSA